MWFLHGLDIRRFPGFDINKLLGFDIGRLLSLDIRILLGFDINRLLGLDIRRLGFVYEQAFRSRYQSTFRPLLLDRSTLPSYHTPSH